MSAKTEDKLILKLILKGQTESEIVEYLESHGLVDNISIYRVQSKIREMKAAQAFLPTKPPTSKVRIFGFILIAIGLSGLFFLKDLSISIERYNPSGGAFWFCVIGLILVIWPTLGLEKI